jgi:alkylation response protein AidB-like acyl-CoA dehydrogenase
MISPSDGSAPLLEAVHRLAPLIREHADEAERNRRLSPPVVAGMAEAGLFRMLTPRALGGLEVPPLTFFRVVEETSRIDGSTGWCLYIGGGIPVQGAFIAAAAADEIFGRDPRMVGAGAVYPLGRAVVAEGGHVVSGRWSYSSGCQHSSWLTVFCNVLDGDTPRLTEAGAPEVRVAFVPTGKTVIHDTWDVSGLVGTGSHDFTLEPVFVPEGYSYRLGPGVPRGENFQGPLYRFPFWGFFTVPIGAVAIGIAQGSVDASLELAREQGRRGRPELQRDRPAFQARLGESVAQLRAARAWLHAAVEQAWDGTRERGSASLSERTDLVLAGTHATHTAAAVVRAMYVEAGGSANYRRSPLQRALRDVHAATQHVGIGPHWFEEGGRLLLGLSPSRPMILV